MRQRSSFDEYLSNKEPNEPQIIEEHTESACYERFYFDDFIARQKLESTIAELAAKLCEVHNSGVNIKSYLLRIDEDLGLLDEGVPFAGARAGAMMGQNIGQKASGLVTGGALGVGGLGLDAAKAAGTGLWQGVKSGATAGWRSLMGQNDNPSVQVKDAIGLLTKAADLALKNYGAKGANVQSQLKSVTDSLNKNLPYLQGLEKPQDQRQPGMPSARQNASTMSWLDQIQGQQPPSNPQAPQPKRQLPIAQRLPDRQQQAAPQSVPKPVVSTSSNRPSGYTNWSPENQRQWRYGQASQR